MCGHWDEASSLTFHFILEDIIKCATKNHDELLCT